MMGRFVNGECPEDFQISDVGHIRDLDGRFWQLNTKAIIELWISYTDNAECASWFDVTEERVLEFSELVFTKDSF